jgi:hypothetical protein
MTEQEFRQLLTEVLETAEFEDSPGNQNWPQLQGHRAESFSDAGFLTRNEGTVITLADGSQFEVTIVQSR